MTDEERISIMLEVHEECDAVSCEVVLLRDKLAERDTEIITLKKQLSEWDLTKIREDNVPYLGGKVVTYVTLGCLKRDTRIGKLEAALREIASLPSKPNGEIGDLWNAVDIAKEALDAE